MTPKKAIIIILVLFLIMVMAFVFLYLNNQPAVNQPIKQSADNSNGGDNNASGQAELTSVQQKTQAIEIKTNQQIEQIIEQGQTSTGGITTEVQRKIDEAVNQEITEKLELRTPEQLKADEQRRAELDKMEQEINQQIRDQLPTQ